MNFDKKKVNLLMKMKEMDANKSKSSPAAAGNSQKSFFQKFLAS